MEGVTLNYLLAELPADQPVPFKLTEGWCFAYGGAVILKDLPGYPLCAYFPGADGMAMALRVNDALKGGIAAQSVLWKPDGT